MNKIKWIVLDKVDSTNDYAKHNVREPNVVVIAKSQTAGKGRAGRRFESHEGGVYMSIVREDNLPYNLCAEYYWAAPLAVCNALEALSIKCKIKWPNDVWVDGKKIAGILIETTMAQGVATKAVIGIGINVGNTIEDVPCAATSCSLEGISIEPMQLAESVVDNLCHLLEEKFAVLLERYKKKVLNLGKTVILGNGRMGVAEDIAPDGRLAVRVDGECIYVAAGDVSLKEE